MQGYTIEDQRLFTVDTVAPVTTVTNATAGVEGSRRSAYFAFSAVDAVPVSFACRLSAAAGPYLAQDALVPQVGAWAACASPQVAHNYDDGCCFTLMANWQGLRCRPSYCKIWQAVGEEGRRIICLPSLPSSRSVQAAHVSAKLHARQACPVTPSRLCPGHGIGA